IDFSTRHFVAALRAGDPLRRLRALSAEAISLCGRGESMRGSVERMLARADALAAKVGGPYARALSVGSRGLALAALASFEEGFRACEEAERIYRNDVRDAPWDRATVQHFLMWTAFEIGRLDVLVERAPRLFEEALARGDHYGATGLAA